MKADKEERKTKQINKMGTPKREGKQSATKVKRKIKQKMREREREREKEKNDICSLDRFIKCQLFVMALVDFVVLVAIMKRQT